MILLDTNILLRYANPTDPMFPAAHTAITTLLTANEVLSIVPQTIYEFWATATRPSTANGLGLTIGEGQQQLVRSRRVFRFLNDHPTLFAEWEKLVTTYPCHGRVSFDARLVAAMNTHGITRILTFNGSDFARFPGIQVVDPKGPFISASPPSATP